jgi:hypothetical protein
MNRDREILNYIISNNSCLCHGSRFMFECAECPLHTRGKCVSHDNALLISNAKEILVELNIKAFLEDE